MGEGRHRRVELIGHRGAAGHAPENTFAAFDRGLELSVDGLETDIRTTKDGVLVLLHDTTVDRTTDGSGAVAELTWREVRRLDAGSWFGQQYAGQRVPRLDEFLDRYGGRTTLRLELKIAGVEQKVLRLLEERELLASSIITSFILDSLRRVKELLPEAHTAYLFGGSTFDRGVVAEAREVGAQQIAPRANLLTPDMVRYARDQGLAVWAWGVRDRGLLRHALGAGVGGLTLDYPEWLDEELQGGRESAPGE